MALCYPYRHKSTQMAQRAQNIWSPTICQKVWQVNFLRTPWSIRVLTQELCFKSLSTSKPGDGNQGRAFLWKLTGQCFYCILGTRWAPSQVVAQGSWGSRSGPPASRLFPLEEERQESCCNIWCVSVSQLECHAFLQLCSWTPAAHVCDLDVTPSSSCV